MGREDRKGISVLSLRAVKITQSIPKEAQIMSCLRREEATRRLQVSREISQVKYVYCICHRSVDYNARINKRIFNIV